MNCQLNERKKLHYRRNPGKKSRCNKLQAIFCQGSGCVPFFPVHSITFNSLNMVKNPAAFRFFFRSFNQFTLQTKSERTGYINQHFYIFSALKKISIAFIFLYY